MSEIENALKAYLVGEIDYGEFRKRLVTTPGYWEWTTRCESACADFEFGYINALEMRAELLEVWLRLRCVWSQTGTENSCEMEILYD